jgi:hypothetical protein
MPIDLQRMALFLGYESIETTTIYLHCGSDAEKTGVGEDCAYQPAIASIRPGRSHSGLPEGPLIMPSHTHPFPRDTPGFHSCGRCTRNNSGLGIMTQVVQA